MRRFFFVLICLIGVAELQAQQPVKSVRATRIANKRIVVDGKLSESEWELASPAKDFMQQQPKFGAAASEPSEIRFLYDDQNLYIGGMLYDDEPGKLVVNELTRDFNARDNDLFVVVLDTFRDKTNAYGFQTNPGAAIRDTQSYDDGRTVNANWDGVWFLNTSVTDKGWMVEEAIPFKSLRFPNTPKQTWGLQVFRLIRRKNEPTLWSPVPRQYNQFKISFGGTLEGIEGVKPGRNIRVTPFFKGTVTEQSSKRTGDADGGVDVKMGVGPSLVLDATYRTDFSQVEVDAQQVNLTRFNLFFPEKRQFFLENQGIFQMGPPPPMTTQSSAQQVGPPDLLPFFSRTIGLSDDGKPIPILAGARLSGRSGRNIIGLMNIQTDEDQSTNFSVFRVGRQFLSNSQASVFYLGKERDGTSNRMGGADVRLNLKQRIDVDGLWMRSSKTGVGNDGAWRMGGGYDWGLNKYTVSYLSLGNNFRDDMGFVPRQGVNIFSTTAMRRVRPKSLGFIREIRPELDFSRYTRAGKGVETQTVNPTMNVDFSDGSSLSMNYRFNDETLSTPFKIRTGYSIPVGHYKFQDSDSNFFTSRARWFSINGGHRWGEYWNGNRHGGTIGGRIRFSPKLATSLTYSRDSIHLPGLAFATNLVALRVDRSFTNRMFLNAFIQYNSQTQQVVSNVRFDFIHHPLSDLFIVYNETHDTHGVTPTVRGLTLKFTRLLTF